MSENIADPNAAIAEHSAYKKFLNKKVKEIILDDPIWPETELPTPKFVPIILPIRKAKGHDPIFVTFLWASDEPCHDFDVLILVQYLDSKGRNCHINDGVHGEVNPDGTFEYAWDKYSENFYAQDYKNATPTDNNVSLHEITQHPFAPPIYHAGVDTIDGFCNSAHKPLTEEDLDDAYVLFCEKYPDAAQGESLE